MPLPKPEHGYTSNKARDYFPASVLDVWNLLILNDGMNGKLGFIQQMWHFLISSNFEIVIKLYNEKVQTFWSTEVINN